MVYFSLNALIDNGLLYAIISSCQDLLVKKYKFEKTTAGSMTTFPYFIYLVAIPIIVKFVSSIGNRIVMIYTIGICECFAFGFLTLFDAQWTALTALFLIGVALSIYINIVQAAIPIVVPP